MKDEHKDLLERMKARRKCLDLPNELYALHDMLKQMELWENRAIIMTGTLGVTDCDKMHDRVCQRVHTWRDRLRDHYKKQASRTMEGITNFVVQDRAARELDDLMRTVFGPPIDSTRMTATEVRERAQAGEVSKRKFKVGTLVKLPLSYAKEQMTGVVTCIHNTSNLGKFRSGQYRLFRRDDFLGSYVVLEHSHIPRRMVSEYFFHIQVIGKDWTAIVSSLDAQLMSLAKD